MITFILSWAGLTAFALLLNYIVQGPQRFEDDN